MQNIETMGARIKRLREAKGWSRHDLSRESDVHYDSLAGYENLRRQPRAGRVFRIARALGVSPEYLMDGVD
jgi:transcriptional regulator with XRE-family HTH domain